VTQLAALAFLAKSLTASVTLSKRCLASTTARRRKTLKVTSQKFFYHCNALSTTRQPPYQCLKLRVEGSMRNAAPLLPEPAKKIENRSVHFVLLLLQFLQFRKIEIVRKNSCLLITTATPYRIGQKLEAWLLE